MRGMSTFAPAVPSGRVTRDVSSGTYRFPSLPAPSQPRRLGRVHVPANLEAEDERREPHRFEDQLHAIDAVAHENTATNT
eukprot:scaffold631_cov19-Phaeocystis_antarctica.AAC.2